MGIANPVPCAVNAVTPFAGKAVASFFAVTAGTITITGANGVAELTAFPVAAGQWIEFDMFVNINGGTITTAGGASGTATVC
jgi:hypothetical protein